MTSLDILREGLPWLLSAVTIWMMVLAGNTRLSAWKVGLFNQALWAVWIVLTSAWGLVPLTLVMTAVCLRNWHKWRREGIGQ